MESNSVTDNVKWIQGEVDETIVYPECQRSTYDTAYAHDFAAHDNPASGASYIYCRRCGLVQNLEVLP